VARWTWWSGDALPPPAPLPGLSTAIETQAGLLTRLTGLDEADRAQMGSPLLGVPLLEAVGQGWVKSPCWRCVISARAHGTDASCWPYQTDGSIGACRCA
jgi:hypothetical protein